MMQIGPNPCSCGGEYGEHTSTCPRRSKRSEAVMSDKTGRIELGEVEWDGPRSYVVVRREGCGAVVAGFSIHNANLDEARRLARWFVAFWNAQVSFNGGQS